MFEWTDESWKSGSPSVHNVDRWPNPTFPDGWADKEWWGINRIPPSGGRGPDVRYLRALFDQLRALWTARLSVTQAGPGQVQVAVQGVVGQPAILETTTNLQVQYWTVSATNAVPFTKTISTGISQPTFFRAELQ